MKLRFFDFEVYPHWWCVSFGDFPDGELNQSNRWDFIKDEIKKDFFTNKLWSDKYGLCC